MFCPFSSSLDFSGCHFGNMPRPPNPTVLRASTSNISVHFDNIITADAPPFLGVIASRRTSPTRKRLAQRRSPARLRQLNLSIMEDCRAVQRSEASRSNHLSGAMCSTVLLLPLTPCDGSLRSFNGSSFKLRVAAVSPRERLAHQRFIRLHCALLST